MGVGRKIGTRRAVFLDRDGVVNEAVVREGRPYPPDSVDSVVIAPETSPAIARLHAMGFLLLVVSNQPDVARGTQSMAAVEAINDLQRRELSIDDFFICYHDSADACDCRKPKPGLILRGADAYDIDLEKSFLIGDRWRDIDAGRAAGVRTIFIDYAYREQRPEPPADATVKNLTEAVAWIATEEEPNR